MAAGALSPRGARDLVPVSRVRTDQLAGDPARRS